MAAVRRHAERDGHEVDEGFGLAKQVVRLAGGDLGVALDDMGTAGSGEGEEVGPLPQLGRYRSQESPEIRGTAGGTMCLRPTTGLTTGFVTGPTTGLITGVITDLVTGPATGLEPLPR